MAKKSTDPPYKGAAGGWPALKASGQVLFRTASALRGSRALMQMNQETGFDCPGCAWPEPEERSAFEFCENGVKAIAAESTSRGIGKDFFAQHSVSELLKKDGYWLESQGRLMEPMVYDGETDHYVPVSWEQALSDIGRRLRELEEPDQAAFYTSGRTSNEAAFLYQLMVRQLGTNNLPDCANMCHESSGKALAMVLGTGKGTVTLKDFECADAIFVWGQNPGTNHPRMLTSLQGASERGAKIVAVNPLRERGLESFIHPQQVGPMLTGKRTPIASLYLQPKVGGDMALMQGLILCVLEAEAANPGKVLDREFISAHTDGFSTMVPEIRNVSWDFILEQTGLTREEIQAAADIFIQAGSVISCWAMGLTQHVHAVPTLQTLANLMLLRGQIGKQGAGVCPVRGHSNVQGDRTMGITPWPKREFLDALGREFSFEPPSEHGVDTVGAIHGMADGKIRIFFALGGNFVEATPDSADTEAAVRKCELTVQVSTKLNRSHLVHGEASYILPCLARSDRDMQASGLQKVSVEDSMSMVHASSGRLEPLSKDMRSEPDIICGLAKEVLPESSVDWEGLASDYGRVREHIEQVLPIFRDYNQRIVDKRGFYLGNSAAERVWKTASGKALFTIHKAPDLNLPEGQLRLMTLRSHDQYNTTIYGKDDRYRGIKNERHVVFVHHDDIQAAGLKDGERVDLVSCFSDKERRVKDFRVVAYDIPRGCAAAYFPETNPLVSVKSLAEISRTPTSKFIPTRLEKRPSS